MQQQQECNIFSFFGPPGSGKGTLAWQCKKEFDCQVLATGDLCRKHIAQGTSLGKLVQQYIQDGRLVPDDVVVEMVMEWLLQEARPSGTVLLDGFPRTPQQAQLFLTFLHERLPFCHYRVFFFELPAQSVIQRLTNRLVCMNKDCQATYSLHANPPKLEGKCNFCGSILGRRQDDAEEVVKERLRVYVEYRDALLNSYRNLKCKVHALDVSGKSKNEVFEWFLEFLTKNSRDICAQ